MRGNKDKDEGKVQSGGKEEPSCQLSGCPGENGRIKPKPMLLYWKDHFHCNRAYERITCVCSCICMCIQYSNSSNEAVMNTPMPGMPSGHGWICSRESVCAGKGSSGGPDKHGKVGWGIAGWRQHSWTWVLVGSVSCLPSRPFALHTQTTESASWTEETGGWKGKGGRRWGGDVHPQWPPSRGGLGDLPLGKGQV